MEARMTKEHQSLPTVLERNLFLKYIIKTAYSKRTENKKPSLFIISYRKIIVLQKGEIIPAQITQAYFCMEYIRDNLEVRETTNHCCTTNPQIKTFHL